MSNKKNLKDYMIRSEAFRNGNFYCDGNLLYAKIFSENMSE